MREGKRGTHIDLKYDRARDWGWGKGKEGGALQEVCITVSRTSYHKYKKEERGEGEWTGTGVLSPKVPRQKGWESDTEMVKENRVGERTQADQSARITTQDRGKYKTREGKRDETINNR